MWLPVDCFSEALKHSFCVTLDHFLNHSEAKLRSEHDGGSMDVPLWPASGSLMIASGSMDDPLLPASGSLMIASGSMDVALQPASGSPGTSAFRTTVDSFGLRGVVSGSIIYSFGLHGVASGSIIYSFGLFTPSGV